MKNLLFILLISMSLGHQAIYGQTGKKYIRKNAHSAEAAADLQALEKALKIMRSYECSNPLSWYYQGAMHWVPDSVIDNKLCASYERVLMT